MLKYGLQCLDYLLYLCAICLYSFFQLLLILPALLFRTKRFDFFRKTLRNNYKMLPNLLLLLFVVS